MLTALFAAIKQGRRLRTNTESFIRAVELGWFANYQIRDRTHDLGLEGFTDDSWPTPGSPWRRTITGLAVLTAARGLSR
jgi:hypothetical protein